MSQYPEIPTSITREIDGVKYIVRKYGYGGQVLEEELIPMPTQKIIRTMKEDGTEDELKRQTIDLKG